MTIENILLEYDSRQSNLLPVLKLIQKEYGFVSVEAVNACAEYFGVKPAAVYSAASFYDRIDTSRSHAVRITICDGTNCTLKKAEQVIKEVEHLTGRKVGDDFDQRIKISRESCLGLCTRGPIVKINEVIFERVTPQIIDDLLAPYLGT